MIAIKKDEESIIWEDLIIEKHNLSMSSTTLLSKANRDVIPESRFIKKIAKVDSCWYQLHLRFYIVLVYKDAVKLRTIV